jgi:8-amino-7-oxononanoate synthase
MAKANIVKYSHNDCQDLAKKLQGGMNGSGALIVTDGVFSMTGAIVDLPGIVKIKKDKPGVRIYIDDAHSFGVLGENGRGTANHFGLTDEVDLVMGTFSKSFASIGGFIASDSDVIEFVRHKATSLIFSAAIPPASAATVLKCIELMEKEPEHLERLHKNTRKMREGFESIGINFVPSETPIISIRVGEEIKTFKLIKELFERGLFACPVVYPAVPYGQSMIRTSYMSTHTDDELEFVLDVFKEIAPKYGLFKKDGESLPSKANGYKLEF